jgi:hypothetical protein
MIQETPSNGSVVITVTTSPYKNTVTPRAVLFVVEKLRMKPVSKLMDRPAWIPSRTEPTTPTTSKMPNAIRNAEARECIRSSTSVRVLIAATLRDDDRRRFLLLAGARRNR